MIAEDTVHPDPKVSLRAWDESWADALETSCNRPLATHRRLWDTLDINLSVVSSPLSQPSQESRMALDKMTGEVCTLQNDLAKAFVQKCIHNDFELKWWEQTRQRLEEVILEGIYRATCVAWLGNQRKMCPEITLRALSSDGGLPYLELVKKVLPPMLASETVAITEPAYVSHSVVDHILSLTPREARVPIVQHQIQVARVSRMYFLTMALWNIFLVYHGEEEEYATSKAFRPTAQDKEWLKAIAAGNAHVEQNMHRRTLREFELERSSQIVACWGCGKAQSTLPAGAKPFQACSKCNAIGRRILYCSRDCQRKDWSHGVPRPHKAFCGKAQPTSELEDLSPATKVQDTSQIMRGCIPDPDPSFHRPPALLHQLTFLRQPPYCDYTVWNQDCTYSNRNTDNSFSSVYVPIPSPRSGFLISTYK
ncbi:hypothetical protein BC629DRAFT_257379 [Irpex lacteus]|nr:hypothetical protein BC629DRAFT_257379 [Irpex lacteus]